LSLDSLFPQATAPAPPVSGPAPARKRP
jgi:hypothetical protein